MCNMFVSAETIVDYKLEVLLVGLRWEKNIIVIYNSRSYKPKWMDPKQDIISEEVDDTGKILTETIDEDE